MRLSHMRGVGAVAAVVGLVLAGFPAGAADTPGTLVIGLDQEPPTLDPHASPSAVTAERQSTTVPNTSCTNAWISIIYSSP